MINVIKASAGSGKTFRLTYEYIKLLLGNKHKGRFVLAPENEHNRHRHILAVTFTNKATGEMKERIRKKLSENNFEKIIQRKKYTENSLKSNYWMKNCMFYNIRKGT